MFAPVNTCNTLFPSFGPPPPPPPPRRESVDMREASCSEARAAQPGQGRHQDHRGGPTAVPSRQTSLKQAKNQQSNSKLCSCSKQLSQLEGRVAKMETDVQASLKSLAADIARLQKERETAWKHVGELQEQNRLMRQRQRELEEQNCLLSRLLEERNDRGKTCAASPFANEMVKTRPPLLSLSLNHLPSVVGMPKVPHMGTDIW